MESGLTRITWQAPWLSPWRQTGEQVAQRVSQGLPLHESLNAQHGAPLRFVPQDQPLSGAAYEHSISLGDCPVRENLHDFFSGLCWLRFPKTKARLNALHAGQIAGGSAQGRRGPVRDALTVFDENGALLDAPQPLWDALLAHDWHALFIDLRPLWGQARLLVFGHALLEKLVAPRKELTAHVWRMQCRLDDIADADAWLAGQLNPQRLAVKPFTPMPVLGVPGWWPPNEDESFYADRRVFRLRRGIGLA